MTADIKTDQTEKRDDEKGREWCDVDIVFADGSTSLAKAAYVGDGWCDVTVKRNGIFCRLWVRANSEVSLPMNPCRLAKPWTAIDAVPETAAAVDAAKPWTPESWNTCPKCKHPVEKAGGDVFFRDGDEARCAGCKAVFVVSFAEDGGPGSLCEPEQCDALLPESKAVAEADPLAGLPEAKRMRILREAGLADGPFSRQRAIAAGIAAFCAQVDILRGSRFTAELAAHGSAADTLSREEAEKSPAAKAETDLLATVPTEERARIVAVAEKASRDNPFECDRAYEAAVAREVAAWHVAHPVCENGCGRARVFGDYCGDCHNSNEPRWQSASETLACAEAADAPQGLGAPALPSLTREETKSALGRLGMGTPVVARLLRDAHSFQPTDTEHGRAVGAVVAAFLRGPDAPRADQDALVADPDRTSLPDHVCSCGVAVGDHEGHPIGKGCDLGANPYGSKHTTAPVRIEYDHGPDGETYRIAVPATPALIAIARRGAEEMAREMGAKWDSVGGRLVEPAEADLLAGATMGAAERATDDELTNIERVLAAPRDACTVGDLLNWCRVLVREVRALRAEREEASAALDVEIGRGDKATGRTYSLRERIGIVMAGLREETKRGDDAEDKVDRLTAELAARPVLLAPEQLRAIVDDLTDTGDSRTVLVSAATVRALLDARPAPVAKRPWTVLDEDPHLTDREPREWPISDASREARAEGAWLAWDGALPGATADIAWTDFHPAAKAAWHAVVSYCDTSRPTAPLSDVDADNTAKRILVEMGIRDDGHVGRVARVLHDIADGGRGHCDGSRRRAPSTAAPRMPERGECAEARESLRVAIEHLTTEDGEDLVEKLFEDAQDIIPRDLLEHCASLLAEYRKRVNALRAAFVTWCAATTLTEGQTRAWETLYRRAAEFMATYPQNYSDEEIAMRDALRAVDDARASRGETGPVPWTGMPVVASSDPCPDGKCAHSRGEHAGITGESGCGVVGCPCMSEENPYRAAVAPIDYPGVRDSLRALAHTMCVMQARDPEQRAQLQRAAEAHDALRYALGDKNPNGETGECAPELDESVSYEWARQALRPVQDAVELHRYEQSLDKVSSAAREAWAHRGVAGESSAETMAERARNAHVYATDPTARAAVDRALDFDAPSPETSPIETRHDPIGLGEPFPDLRPRQAANRTETGPRLWTGVSVIARPAPVPMPDMSQGSPPGCPVPMPKLAPTPPDEEKH